MRKDHLPLPKSHKTLSSKTESSDDEAQLGMEISNLAEKRYSQKFQSK
jgi:hypothetical protein